jgi:hypothetical protein
MRSLVSTCTPPVDHFFAARAQTAGRGSGNSPIKDSVHLHRLSVSWSVIHIFLNCPTLNDGALTIVVKSKGGPVVKNVFLAAQETT